MGSRSAFRIAFSFATSVAAPLELCSKRIRVRRYHGSNMIMKDPELGACAKYPRPGAKYPRPVPEYYSCEGAGEVSGEGGGGGVDGSVGVAAQCTCIFFWTSLS
jgi:hypothetical protein